MAKNPKPQGWNSEGCAIVSVTKPNGAGSLCLIAAVLPVDKFTDHFNKTVEVLEKKGGEAIIDVDVIPGTSQGRDTRRPFTKRVKI